MKKEKNQVMRLLLDLGKAYEGKRDYTNAFYYTRDLMLNARNHNVLQYVRDAYKQMHLLHEQLHHTDIAYYYLRNWKWKKTGADRVT